MLPTKTAGIITLDDWCGKRVREWVCVKRVRERVCVCAGTPFTTNYFTEMCSGSEAGSYLWLIDLCIAQP